MDTRYVQRATFRFAINSWVDFLQERSRQSICFSLIKSILVKNPISIIAGLASRFTGICFVDFLPLVTGDDIVHGRKLGQVVKAISQERRTVLSEKIVRSPWAVNGHIFMQTRFRLNPGWCR